MRIRAGQCPGRAAHGPGPGARGWSPPLVSSMADYGDHAAVRRDLARDTLASVFRPYSVVTAAPANPERDKAITRRLNRNCLL
jgi:hypothetical protein